MIKIIMVVMPLHDDDHHILQENSSPPPPPGEAQKGAREGEGEAEEWGEA